MISEKFILDLEVVLPLGIKKDTRSSLILTMIIILMPAGTSS